MTRPSIYPLARWLADLLGNEPPIFSLGPKLTEEALWEQRFVGARDQAADREDAGFRRVPGRLAGFSRQPGIVVVPDLTQLGLPAARAGATLIGADVAHLERLGMSRTWRPRDRWLAAMRRQDAGRVAPHLLDRFALRVDAADLSLPRDGGPVLPVAESAWLRAVRDTRAGRSLQALSIAAADRVVALVPPGAVGARRDLALGRLARALAGLAGQAEASPGQVDSAAELIGLPGRRPGPQLLPEPVGEGAAALSEYCAVR